MLVHSFKLFTVLTNSRSTLFYYCPFDRLFEVYSIIIAILNKTGNREVIKLGKCHIAGSEAGSEICIFIVVLYQPASYWKCNLFCSFFGKFSSWLPHWTPWKKPLKAAFTFPCPQCNSAVSMWQVLSTWGFSFQSVGVTSLLLNVIASLGSLPLALLFYSVSLALIHIWSSF